jgi:mRNA interferase HicA
MSIVPVLAAREVLRKLFKAGFRFVVQKGSHIKVRNDTTKITVEVPFHTKDLGRGLLTKIIKQSKIPLDKFLRL